ncbi:MAG: hypothetical protein J5850_04725, partial [Clostridia bacterium]|nr:hypothetical protein [Clostridia bacterium]
MKTVKSLLSLLLIIVMSLPLLSSCFGILQYDIYLSDVTELMTENVFVDCYNVGTKKDDRFGFISSSSVDNCKAVLIEAMRDYQSSCNISSYMINKDLLSDILIDILNDSPDLFFVSQSFSYSYNKNNIVTNVYLSYTIDGSSVSSKEEIDEAVRFYNESIIHITSLMPAGLDDYGKALWLHDYLCINYKYDNSLVGSNAYYMFKYGTGVCHAYTDSYMALLRACGVDCSYCVSTDMKHIWNQVKIAGNWYHVDVTWDDAEDSNGNDVPGRALHTSFLLSDSSISGDHYNYSGKACSSSFYDDSLIHGINTPLAFANGKW